MGYSPEIAKKIKDGRSRFIAMALTYFLGVFNDNFFKQAAMLLAVSVGKNSLQGEATVWFSLPFIVFSAYAGWLADRFSKRNVVIAVKFLEFVAMLIGAAGLLTLNWFLIISMVFLMGLQSTLFGPALNGSIPELYPEVYVPKANAVIKLVTTVAILLGVALAGIALDQNWMDTEISFGRILVALSAVAIAGAGVLASFGTSKVAPPNKKLVFPLAGPLNSLKELLQISKDSELFIIYFGDI